ncbi:MAG: AAA family ATPase [Alistipes sp.]|nr:AAA family ATPase [Alistipes sp.]
MENISENEKSNSITYDDFVKNLKDKAKDFGANGSNSTIRENNKEFFIIAREGEQESGLYHDLSFVVFRRMKDKDKEYKLKDNICLLAIGVGSSGLNNDQDEAALPKWRRAFLKLLPKAERRFTDNGLIKEENKDVETINCYPIIKGSFADIDSKLSFDNEIELGFRKETMVKYEKYLPCSMVIDLNDENDKAIAIGWLAQYAKLRKWYLHGNGNEKSGASKNINKAIEEACNACGNSAATNSEVEVKGLLEKRRFVVLQGAPGVGKTYLADKIAQDYGNNVFFTQFHAETSYSDFVSGILPDTTVQDELIYKRKPGVLVNAINYALDYPKENTLLIIDEINRANLANVLGPVFYLFEPTRKDDGNRKYMIEVGSKHIDTLPDNLYVLGTMNTADRSLAVVDYALRRRFAWYTIEPKAFESIADDEVFHTELFNEMAEIFEWYASDDELNLQPGPSYFLTKKEEAENEIKYRLEYELMPLIKEYLNEGMLIKAKDSFVNYFYKHIKKHLFK